MPLTPGTLTSGTRIGAYEILSALGAGGMGQVYRARDTKLDREVAIKVLPDGVAHDHDRLARFAREAKVLASLNHANIAQIYGLEENALVMELVTGSTLSVPQPLETALDYARQIAEALEAAHEKGITHRDLKPGNIMVTPEGVVKVLDFGLASAPSRAGAGDPNSSPTMTVAAPTEAGMIMGTAAYMSPEQAAGKAVDKRSDIWSFGVVLYEMLSGRQLFAGETVSHTLADVLRRPIDFADMKAPQPIVGLLKRCLDRDLKTRLQAIGEARIAITRYLADPKSGTGIQSEQAGANFRWVPWAMLATALALALTVASVGWYRATRPDAPKPLMRLSVDLGPEAVRGRHATMVLSPDGRRIVFTGRAPGGGTQLFTRMTDQAEAVPIPGTLGAPGPWGAGLDPFFSPDGEWVGFFADGKLKKVAVNGGAVVTLGSALVASGGSWGDDGNIVIGTFKGLQRFPAGGGTAQLVATGFSLFPDVLPGGQSVLFDSSRSGLPPGIEALQFSTGQTKVLVPNGYEPLYLPTSRDTGHLVYLQDGTLFGVPFDPRRLEIRGRPVPLLQDVSAGLDLGEGTGQITFSGNGTLAYLPSLDLATYPVLWLDAAGKTTPLIQKPDAYNTPRLSPDGKWLAYTLRGKSGKTDVWVCDLDRQTPAQLTFTGPGRGELVWAADSRHLIFGDAAALWWIRADGSGQPQQLLGNLENPRPFSLAPAGRLAIVQQNEGLPGIYTVPIDLSDLGPPKAGKEEPFLADATVVQVDPAFSPDGKFLAYASTESGSNEIFVRPFPGPGGKWKVSQSGGKFPVWSRAAHELLFLGGDGHIMVVDYSAQGDLFRAGKPRVWSPVAIRRMGLRQNFDLSPDGKRVVMFPQPESQESLHFTFLLNFFDEVRRKVPANGK
jgi:Tol biopolymer transport system component/predicted Ser/Thr protein kinase